MSEDQLLGVQNHPIRSFSIGWFCHTNGKSSSCLGYQGIVAVNQSLQKSDPFTFVNDLCLAPQLTGHYRAKVGYLYFYGCTEFTSIQHRDQGTPHTRICQGIDDCTVDDSIRV